MTFSSDLGLMRDHQYLTALSKCAQQVAHHLCNAATYTGHRLRRNTMVGEVAVSAATTCRARLIRDSSSPPEATLLSGPGVAPGLVAIKNSMSSAPLGSGLSSLNGISAISNTHLVMARSASVFITRCDSRTAASRRRSERALACVRQANAVSSSTSSSDASSSVPPPAIRAPPARLPAVREAHRVVRDACAPYREGRSVAPQLP